MWHAPTVVRNAAAGQVNYKHLLWQPDHHRILCDPKTCQALRCQPTAALQLDPNIVHSAQGSRGFVVQGQCSKLMNQDLCVSFWPAYMEGLVGLAISWGKLLGLDVFFHHRGESFRLPLSKRQPRPPLMSRSHAKCSIEGPVNTNYNYYLSRGHY